MKEKQAPHYDLTKPWNSGVRGSQVLPLINDDAPVIRIEAGPGTGKTFALAGIFLRLLVEEKIPASDILVVTFTEAATAELRDRIRRTIRACWRPRGACARSCP